MIEAKERDTMKENLNMFKKLANHNPPTPDSALNPKVFEDWIRGILEDEFVHLQ